MNGNLHLMFATAYASLGWRVVPLEWVRVDGSCSCNGRSESCSPGKHPRTTHGLKDATTDGKAVTEWWRETPEANIAIVTGEASGIFMVGPDGQAGIAALRDLEIANRELCNGGIPATVTAHSGGGGAHFLFKWPDREPIRNKRSNRGLPIDIRGEGGYFVAPPSTHASGQRYAWISGPFSPAVAVAPAWLLEWCREAPATPARPVPTAGLNGRLAVIERAVRYLAKIPPAISGQGGHNRTFDAARSLVWGFDLDIDMAFSLLAAHYNPRCVPQWSEKELAHKVKQADSTTFGKPRGWLLAEKE